MARRCQDESVARVGSGDLKRLPLALLGVSRKPLRWHRLPWGVPLNLRTLPALSGGENPVFAKCPAHTGTGATWSAEDPEYAQESGPYGHRGNNATQYINTPHGVRPIRAQGQRDRVGLPSTGPASGPYGHRGNVAPRTSNTAPCSPAHTGTGATSATEVLSGAGFRPAHTGTGATDVLNLRLCCVDVRPTRAAGRTSPGFPPAGQGG